MMRRLPLRNEAGQAAALVALLLFFVFLPLAALAIDGGIVYLMRRDLQNAADAAALSACRVIAYDDTTTTPLAAALNTVQTNLGAWAAYVGSNPPASNVPFEGAGPSLIKGVEVSDREVRVALQRLAPTVLTQFLGRGETPVTAQARCDATAGGGLLPIAVQRYDADGDPVVDYLASATHIYPTDSETQTWESYYDVPFEVPVPVAYPPSDDTPGPEVVLLGQQADTNNSVPSMRNLVLLDIRNVASQNNLEYYNFADSQADAEKDLSRDWIRQHGYPGPIPEVGSQVAILDGASNDYTARALYLDAQYQPGDLVAAIVYDGNVWQRPDFSVSLQPAAAGNGIAASSDAIMAYNVQIVPSAWSAPSYFNLNFTFTNSPVPGGTHVSLNGTELSAPNYSYLANIGGTWNGTLSIWNTTVLTQPYLSGLDMVATSEGVVHGASSNYGFGSVNPDFALRTNHGELVLNPKTNNQVNLTTFGIGAAIPNNKNGCLNVPIAATLGAGNWDYFFSSSPNQQVTLPRGEATQAFQLNVLSGAPVQSGLTLHFTVGGSSSCGTLPLHIVDIPLDIVSPPSNATPDKFVIIQGYSVFRITRVEPNVNSPNTVYAEAVRPLVSSYDRITVGLRPRLVPWN